MSPIAPQDDLPTGRADRQVPTAEQKKVITFTILHTNDMHSNLVGIGPASEYSPTTLNDDGTIGGIERIAALIAERRKAREALGPVLVLDIGDSASVHPLVRRSRRPGRNSNAWRWRDMMR